MSRNLKFFASEKTEPSGKMNQKFKSNFNFEKIQKNDKSFLLQRTQGNKSDMSSIVKTKIPIKKVISTEFIDSDKEDFNV